MFRFFKFTNEPSFYTLLRQHAELAHEAARVLHEGCKTCEGYGPLADRVEDIEQKSEDQRKMIARLIDTSFITPLDKEDLDHLTRYLDKIVQAVHGAARRLDQYPVGPCRPDLPPLAEVAQQMTGTLVQAFKQVELHPSWALMTPMLERIHAQEKEADALLRDALAALFKEPGAEPLKVMQWKEIYEWVEEATDRCQAVADWLERVGVKYA
jgi:uncharacterized protein Yka (UPF0111/DUF47 family)